MDIEQLNCFCLAYETRSLSQAAQRCFLTRQGMSKLVRRMEDEWGLSLFVRKPDGLYPTDTAHDVYPLAKNIVASYQDILGIVAHAEADREAKLPVAVAHGTINSLGGSLFTDFNDRHPEIPVSVTVASARECETMVINGQCAVALSAGPVEFEGLNATLLKQGPLYFIGLNELLDESGGIPCGTRLFLLGSDFKLDTALLEELGPDTSSFVIDNSFTDYDAIMELVKAGTGICIGPDAYLNTFDRKRTFAIPVPGQNCYWSVLLLTPANRPLPPAARVFANHVRHYANASTDE
jgi:DNA-binding transcriptional LysR family regulator